MIGNSSEEAGAPQEPLSFITNPILRKWLQRRAEDMTAGGEPITPEGMAERILHAVATQSYPLAETREEEDKMREAHRLREARISWCESEAGRQGFHRGAFDHRL